MSSDIESVEVLGAGAVADISTLIERRLREEHLDHFIRSRDELMRLEHPDDSKIIRQLRRQYLHALEKTWDSLLQNLRSELPKSLDEVLNKLKQEFPKAGGSAAGSLYTTPLTPLSASTKIAGFRLTNQDPKVSDATATSPTPNNHNCSISTTLSPAFAVAEKDKSSTVPCTSIAEAGSSVIKRALDPEEPYPIFKKKAKRTPQINRTIADKPPLKNSISLREVERGECIYRYGGYTGFYVLRCNASKCKKRLRRDSPTLFTSHPFKDGLASDHFSEGHNVKSESEIFRKFAIRVTDAMSECNVEKKNNQISHGSPTGQNIASPPTSPWTSRDKGKQPERVFNLNPTRIEAAEASTSASGANIQESFRESARGSATLSDDDELPTLERALRFDSRGRKIPNYTLPPYDEFDV
ncbi:hypothetical protein HD806DRAFT_94392 [Xylariaceae sp. AK1471]|nr:hypothetical protein HD806DRAFT_94392 [Xylariaceae sp. AK1471]